ncbi:MAG: 5-methylthioadenosine/S-adenosylhomocysteine deaminase [Fusobacteria bacterium]|nr:MAG: 5-methylthioadenosine/S-adenosylhomocysteine deaminase [Fusobacteriota bacterium]KAF0229988.1 MAG: 5-methylthioadenosine/S-adenosylhomocysteine [Fusobacteriota bacterium]
MGYLFKNISLITMDPSRPEVVKGDLLIEGSKIISIGSNLPKSAHKVIEGRNLLVMPGFINTHTHVSMSLLRGYGDDLELFEWLNNRIWPVETKLTKNDVYVGAKLGIAEMLLSGTTTFLDMYQDMEMVAKAIVETGIRGHISRGTIYTGNEKMDKAALDQLESLIDDFHNYDDERIKVLAGPHAIYTNSKEFLEAQLEIVKRRNIGLHIHVSETKKENEDIIKTHGMTPVEYLNDIGLLDAPYVVSAHMIYLNEGDQDIVKEKGVGIAHNPKSNLKLGSGMANVQKYLKKGITVGLGTDGASSNNNLDMLSEMQYATMIQKGLNLDATALNAYDTLKMATTEGAKVLNISDRVGMLKEGYDADLIMFDLNQPHYYPIENNLVSKIAYSAKSSDIIMTMVKGKPLMVNRELKTIDIEKTYKEVSEIIGRIC